jgi:zinc-ribbon family
MSFIIIGFGKKTFKDLGETGTEQRCVWCATAVFYHLIRIRTWFTYFFIPVFPYRSEYRIECPTCYQGVEIRGQEIKSAKLGELVLYTEPYTKK